MMNLNETLQQAVACHQAGQLPEAEELYLSILQVEPNHPDANHNLGLMALQLGKAEIGFIYLETAWRADPSVGQYWFSLTECLLAMGHASDALLLIKEAIKRGFKSQQAQQLLMRAKGGNSKAQPSPAVVQEISALSNSAHYAELEERIKPLVERYPNWAWGWGLLGIALHMQGKAGESALRRAVELTPNDAAAHNNLGGVLKDHGNMDAAAASFRKALKINPKFTEAYCNLAVVLQAQGRLNEAMASLRQAVKINPKFAKAHNNLGCILKDLGQLDDAVASFRLALEIKPDYAEAHNNLGSALKALGQPDGAAASYRRALEIKPDYAEAHSSLGGALTDLGQLDNAVASCRRALEIKPDFAEAYNNLGNALYVQGEFEAAIASCRQALKLQPDFAEARNNLGYAHLSCGQLAEGWENYEFRICTGKMRFPLLPYWAGENLDGKSILVWGEQGVGDEILFASVLPDVIQAAGHCVVECDSRLVSLFARSFPQAEIVPRSNPPHPRLSQPDIQLQCPMGNLPRWFRTSLESFPQHHDYLKADPERVAFWKRRLDALGSAPKVGICWRSRLRNASRDFHYTELSQWGPILAAPGSVFVNLQYDDCRAELEAAREQFGVEIHAWDDIDLMNDLDEAAALTCALDLVISANTSVFSMAGALGKPVWLINLKNDWAALGTGAMPWFPDTRLFVKDNAQNSWDAVIGDIAEALKQRISG